MAKKEEMSANDKVMKVAIARIWLEILIWVTETSEKEEQDNFRS